MRNRNWIRATNISFSLIAACLSFSCSRGVHVEDKLQNRGIFVYNSREVKKRAVEIDEDGDVRPEDRVKFGQFRSYPELLFRGRLAEGQDREFDLKKKPRSDEIRTLSREEFHASGPEKTKLVSQGKLKPDERTLAEAVGEAGELVIFVHGFNVSARDAAEQSVKLARELDSQNVEAPVMFYSWPTSSALVQVVLGETLRRVTLGHVDAVLNDVYLNDRKNIDLAAYSLYRWFEELDEKYPDLKLHIIGHSMGSEVVMKSLQFWHHNRMIDDKRSPEEIFILDRVILVGADIGLRLFEIMAKPCAASAREILVYVNPRDAVLEEASELTRQQRVGLRPPDFSDYNPDVSQQYVFVELQGPIVRRGFNLVKQLRVGHNPLKDERIRHHACRFLATGEIAEDTEQVIVEPVDPGNFRGSGAGRYSLRVKAGAAEKVGEAFEGVISARRKTTDELPVPQP